MDFLIRNPTTLIPLAAGIVLLAEGLRRTLRSRNGRRWMQAGAVLVLAGFWGLGRPASTRAAAAETWTAVAEPDRFSVMLPAERAYSAFDDHTPFGAARTHKWKATADGGRVSYIFRYSELPAGAEYPDPQAALEAIVKSLDDTNGSRVAAASPVSVGRFAGREVAGELGGVPFRGRFVVTPTRAYALIRTTARGAPPSGDAFFASFALDAR